MEGSLTYDANGNITHLNRIDDRAFTSFNSDYTFVPNTNKVDKLGLGGGIATQYAYNEIGETVTQVDAQSLVNPTASDRRFEYDAAGRITAIRVKLDSSPTPYLLAEYKYDEQGNCIYDLIYTDPADWTSLKRTSYVRDGSGNVLATYVYEFRVQGFGSGAQLQEQIVYGASRLGVYRRAYAGQPAEQLYEHYDHLGNTRVVYRRPTTTRYSLTMEDGRVQTEKNDFPDPANSPGRYDAVRSTNYSKSGLFSMRLGSATSLISPTKRLTVGKGDKVDMQVFAFYRELTLGSSGNRGLGKIGLAAGATGVILPQPGIGIDGQSNNQNQLNQLLGKVQVGVAIPLLSKLKPAPGARAAAVGGWYPAAQLQYDFTGTDGTVKSDYAFVTTDANNAWQQLNLSIDIDRPGTLDVYMVTQNGERVYFDDLTIDHKIGPIVQENNFYAYGMPMPGISWTRPNVRRERSGYQGLFAQYDEETKLNRFQLRMYDSRTGRWLSKDPYGQYASPYVGMGNNPTNGVDPNGGIFEKQRAQFSAWIHAGTWGKDENNGYYSQWTDKQVAGHYFGQQQGARDIYNSNLARVYIPDEFQFSVNANLAAPFKGVGVGKDLTLVFFTRGDYAFRPYLSTTTTRRFGTEASAGLSGGLGHYHGPVSDIGPSTMEGRTLDASVAVGTGFGVALGMNGTKVAWDVESVGIKGLGGGVSGGEGNTEMYDIINETQTAIAPYRNAWSEGMQSINGNHFIF